MKTRTAQPADANAVQQCVDAACRHYIPILGKPPGPMLEDYAEIIRRHSVFVAQESGQVAGVLVLMATKSTMLLDNVAVHPEYQGKGIGRRLLELAEAETRKRKYSHLDLYTHECMTENIGMYLRNGYVETERRYRRVYMWKTLLKGVLSPSPLNRCPATPDACSTGFPLARE